MTKKYTAQCACGAVKFEFNTDPDFVASCHCLDCKKASGGEMARFFTNNLGSFPGVVFVMLGSLDRPELIEPKLEMFTRRRLKWAKPLDLPQFDSMPS